MKNALFIFMLASLNLFSQDLPTIAAQGYAFPIGSKFTIQMVKIDSTNFHYSIIKFEQFHEIVDSWENDTLFNETGEEGTIDFYFCLGTHGDTEEEKEKNMEVLLIQKNRTKYHFRYDSEILLDEVGEFQETSNVGSYSGAFGTERWPYMIYQIGLSNFRLAH